MWIRGRSLRPGRNDNDEDEFQLDLTKDHSENIRDILTNICKKQGITSERRRLSYLNAFVKLLSKCEHDYAKLGFNAEEILYCLRPALLHDTTQVRSGGLRALRYMLRSRHEAVISYKLQYPILIARSLDLITGNDNERVQAMRVVRRLMCLDVALFPVCLARALVAIASGTEDRLINLTLGALAELCVLNPELLISVGGVTTILRSLSNVKSARMAEALVGSLLYLQNKPGTRLRAGLSLDCLAAPYTDLQPGDKTKENQASDRLKWPHVTLLSTLRSWPGVLHFCHPLKDGLRSIVATLYLNQLDVRKAVLDLLYELLCLAQPEWSDEMSVALEAVDPSRTQDAFKLSEGFVAAEGKAVLPHLSKCRVNLSELHLSLLLYCFLEVGLLDAIVEVIIAEDTFLSVRATILLGELLHLIHLLLPPECCHLTPSLPNLLSYAVRGRPHSNMLLGYPETPITPQSSLQSNVESFIGVDVTNKKDIISRMGIRSGHSSVRTVSESSNTDRAAKPEITEFADKQTANEEGSPYNSEKRDISNSNRRNSKSRGDQTCHLLKDVREVLADMTNAADVKSPFKTATRSRHKSTSISTSLPSMPLPSPSPSPDAPICVRAQQRALAAVTALSRLHRLLRLRPAPASIHLDHVLASVSGTHTLDGVELARAKGKTLSRNKLSQALTKECDEAIKESQVLTNKDCFLWNWDIIRSILKSRPECLKKCEESQHRQFVRRLVQFVLPSSRQMSRVDFSSDRRTVNVYTLTAIELLDILLLGTDESELEKLLIELLIGVKTQFEAISTSKSAHDCMFSPQAVTNSLCQDYFLLAGHLTRTKQGCDLLDKLGIIQVLLVLATTSKHDCYVKLIISNLDYSSDERIRNIMASTLVSQQVPSRLYATKFLRVLLRTSLSKREGYAQWVIELLANQLSDDNRAVSLCAVAALDEACDCKEYLDALIDLRPSLLHLGDKGLLLLIRFLSTEKGFRYMSEANFVSTQLAKWVRFNYKYVCIVEGEVADGLTLVERNEDGRYSSRLSHSKREPSDVYVPPHLYGQLAQHSPGLNVLLADDNVNKMAQLVLEGQCSTDSEILDLKAALWALGHLSSSPGGALWARGRCITKALVRLACTSPVYSIRSTAFHAIALTATNAEGADTLRSLGWHTVRHNRNQQWPVVPPLSLLEDALLQYQEERYGTRESSESSATNTDTTTRNGLFILGEDPSVEGDKNDSFCGFTARERAARERKSATLPPTGSFHAASHGYHHNRSFSESKADSGSDITDFRGQDNTRLYSESSTSGASSCGDSSQPRTYISERLMQTLSPIPSTDSLSTIRSHRRLSVASSQGGQMSPQDMVGYAALRSLQRSRRPTLFTSPHLPLHFPPAASHSLSPISPIELFAFQDWKQMSPLVRPKHPDNHALEPQFEVTGVHCPLPSDSQTPRTLHYESSRACIAQPPEDHIDEENSGSCYQGICLPQHLIVLFPEEEIRVKAQDPQQDNNSTTGMDISSCDSETDTEGERGNKPSVPHRRRHERSTCLLCAVSRVSHTHQPRWRKVSASSQHRTRTETESSYGGEGESPVVLQWHNKVGLEGITSVDSSSTDITSIAQRSLGDSFKSRSMVRKEILRLAEQLCNPILYKTCKQALMQLKQMYSDVFNDVCVYSDVCAVMASASLRIYARRFLQELFLDAPFSEIYEEPLNMLTNQNNADNEDGACGDKISIGSEPASNEDYPIETNSWKSSGPKINGFDSEVRSGQGYELEVILESDARSESSDVCRLSGEGGRGSITPLEPKVFPEDKSLTDKRVSEDYGQVPDGVECHLTVSRSSQQLRKEFFNSALSSESKLNPEKDGVTPSEAKNIKHNESFVSKVADSITKSQCMLETKLPSQQDDSSSSVKVEKAVKESTFVQLNVNVNDVKSEEHVYQQPDNVNHSEANSVKGEAVISPLVTLDSTHGKKVKRSLNLVDKQSSKVEGFKPQSDSSEKCEKSKPGKGDVKLSNEATSIHDSSSNISNLNKSPQSTKKGKKLNNTKASSLHSKTEVPSHKTFTEQSMIQNFENYNQRRENISPKANNELKCDSLVKNDITKIQSKTSDTVTDASSSKVPSKSTKMKSGESTSSSGKPPSGLGRQRKKATSKTPTRDNLDSMKKKPESENR